MKKRKNLNVWLAMSFFLLGMDGLIQGRTITVGHGAGYDYNTVQDGIDTAEEGDTVLVSDGIYRGDIDFKGKAITVRSENGPENCVLSGGAYVVYFHNGETPASVLSGFTITHGDPDAGIGCWDSSPTIMNNIITNNWSEYGEGAVFVHNSSPIIVGNIITGNEVYGSSAGIVCCHGSSPIIANNTIVGNGGNGGWYGNGGVYCTCGATATITNCIFWDNGEYDLYGCSATYSCLEHLVTGEGNISVDPLFVNPGHSGGYGWVDWDYHLRSNSPCIDAGDNWAVPLSAIVDLRGHFRFADDPITPDTGAGRLPIVDMGAYEYGPSRGFLLSSNLVIVPEGDAATFTVALTSDPLATIEVTVIHLSGDSDITVASGALLTFDSSNYWQPQTVTLAASEDDDYVKGKALIWITAPGFCAARVTAIEGENEFPPTVLYVDMDSPDNNGGTSWADAYTHLQDALGLAATFSEVEEIRVAQGIYKPDQGVGVARRDRTATFQLLSGLAIKGGYAGFGEPDPDDRNIDLYETILSGDLNGDDVEVANPPDLWDEPTRSENSYNVVTGGNWIDATAVLDGFTISGGNANGQTNPYRLGGGMHNSHSGNPTVSNCTFTRNSGVFGGAVFNYGNSEFVDCTFNINSADTRGGGMFNGYYCKPQLSNCNFRQNWAGCDGGGLYNDYESDPCFINCTVTNNSAKNFGGGMYIGSDSSPIMANCLFSGNVAFNGGAISQSGRSRMKLTNCTLSDNCATKYGGGIYNCCDWGSSSKPTLTNCILWNNRDSDGTDESAQIHREDSGTMVVTFSCIQGWTRILRGNIDVDPCFVKPGYWDSNGIWVDGDYHLLPDSPCINAGDPNYIAEPNEMDLDGKPRVIGGRIDMGAFEYSPPIPAEVRIVPRSINLASRGNWITCYIWLGEDYDVADIDANSVFLEGEIEAESLQVYEQAQVATARFSREDVQAILDIGEVELTITGRLTNGFAFEGTDVIRVIDKGRGK